MRTPLRETSAALVRTEIRPDLWLDARRALWVESGRLLVVADLHWGYVACHRARGNLLPVWGDDEMASSLTALIADYAPAEMIWLGDVVHAAEGGARADAFARAAGVPVTLLAGNHDRRWNGARERSCVRGEYFFHHGDQTLPVPAGCIEVVGHHHPAVSWGDGAGGRAKLPALVTSARRIVLPAFSPWAAGTSWRPDLRGEETLWAIAPRRIFALPQPRPLSPSRVAP